MQYLTYNSIKGKRISNIQISHIIVIYRNSLRNDASMCCDGICYGIFLAVFTFDRVVLNKMLFKIYTNDGRCCINSPVLIQVKRH